MNMLSKQCETFVNLATKVKKSTKNGVQSPISKNIDKENIMSQLESYSILEKIHEWKKEEGVL